MTDIDHTRLSDAERDEREALIRERDEARAMLREATEVEFGSPCRLDHHDHCQEHGYDSPCLIPRAEAALADGGTP